MAFVFSNNARSTLAAPLGAGDDTLLVQAADAALFPAPAPGDQFAVTLKDQLTGEYEIVYCTARDGVTLEIDRAQEGTVALAFPAGAIVSHNLTAGVLEYLRDL